MTCSNCGSELTIIEHHHATIFECFRATRRERDAYKSQIESQKTVTPSRELVNWQPVLIGEVK